MKESRSGFAKPRTESDVDWVEIKNYCGLECMKLAEMMKRVIQAHRDAGLQLTAFNGAGSTGAAMLEKMNARAFIKRRWTPTKSLSGGKVVKGKPKWLDLSYEPHLKDAISRAFFGGRFEVSRVGPYLGPVWSYDISSAYPYAICFLPCLVHGSWEHRTMHDGLQREVEEASAALVRYELPHTRGVGRINNNAW